MSSWIPTALPKADNRRGPCGHDSHGHKKQLWKKYPETCGISGYDTAPIRERQLIMSSGIDYEFRTTVMREFHLDDIRAIAKRNSGRKGLLPSGPTGIPDILKGGYMPRTAQARKPPNAELRGYTPLSRNWDVVLPKSLWSKAQEGIMRQFLP